MYAICRTKIKENWYLSINLPHEINIWNVTWIEILLITSGLYSTTKPDKNLKKKSATGHTY